MDIAFSWRQVHRAKKVCRGGGRGRDGVKREFESATIKVDLFEIPGQAWLLHSSFSAPYRPIIWSGGGSEVYTADSCSEWCCLRTAQEGWLWWPQWPSTENTHTCTHPQLSSDCSIEKHGNRSVHWQWWPCEAVKGGGVRFLKHSHRHMFVESLRNVKQFFSVWNGGCKHTVTTTTHWRVNGPLKAAVAAHQNTVWWLFFPPQLFLLICDPCAVKMFYRDFWEKGTNRERKVVFKCTCDLRLPILMVSIVPPRKRFLITTRTLEEKPAPVQRLADSGVTAWGTLRTSSVCNHRSQMITFQ